MKSHNTKAIVISSLFWKVMERGGSQGIQFIIQIVLARLLLPEDYGMIALVTIFIIFANVFIQSGLNTALIQKKNTTEEDFSSVFYLSLLIAFLLYIILFFAAPFIANFYDQQEFTSVFRVLCIILFFGALNSIQNAVVARNMLFKKLFYSTLSSIMISGTLGIILANYGFGVWALVVQQVTNHFLITIILWFTVKWRPRLLFSINRVKILFSFGWKILVSTLVDTIYINLQSLIIGKMYNSEMLGFYNRGKQFPELITGTINGSIQSVMLPTLSSLQDDTNRVKNMVRRSIVTSSFIVFPIMIGLAVIAEPLITVVLTEKWLPSVPFLQIYCLIYALWPIHTANLQAINALGRSDIYLKVEMIKKIIGLFILGFTVFFGVYAMVIGGLIGGIINTVINTHPNSKLLNYSFKEQWKDIMPSLLLAIVMGMIIYNVNFQVLGIIFTLVVKILLGVIFYFSMAYLFKLECLNYLLKTIRESINSKNKHETPNL